MARQDVDDELLALVDPGEEDGGGRRSHSHSHSHGHGHGHGQGYGSSPGPEGSGSGGSGGGGGGGGGSGGGSGTGGAGGGPAATAGYDSGSGEDMDVSSDEGPSASFPGRASSAAAPGTGAGAGSSAVRGTRDDDDDDDDGWGPSVAKRRARSGDRADSPGGATGDGKSGRLRLARGNGFGRKRRRDDTSDEGERASGAEDSDEEIPNPYPLEDKYKDEEDRERLLSMNEIEREEILAERDEEMTKRSQRIELARLAKAQRGETVASTAKSRRKTQVGASQKKKDTLETLKKRRQAKAGGKRRDSPTGRRRSSSSSGSEYSDEEEGEYDKFQRKDFEEEARLRSELPVLADIEGARVGRSFMEERHLWPKFSEWVKGAFVRYMIGNDRSGRPTYRVCEVKDVTVKDRSYKFGDGRANAGLLLKHGKAEKVFTMEYVSNSPFTEDEFRRWLAVMREEGQIMPLRKTLKARRELLLDARDYVRTEADIQKILERRRQITKPTVNIPMERARLLAARTAAALENNVTEVERIDGELQDMAMIEAEKQAVSAGVPATVQAGTGGPGAGGGQMKVIDEGKLMAEMNERNRKANWEAMKRAEARKLEEKRRLRSRHSSASKSGMASPAAPGAPVPKLNGINGANANGATQSALSFSSLSSPKEGEGRPTARFLELMAYGADVEVDLGDF